MFRYRLCWLTQQTVIDHNPNVLVQWGMLFLQAARSISTPEKSRSHSVWSNGFKWHICSMYGISTNIYHTNHPNVGKYTVHGANGNGIDHFCQDGFDHLSFLAAYAYAISATQCWPVAAAVSNVIWSHLAGHFVCSLQVKLIFDPPQMHLPVQYFWLDKFGIMVLQIPWMCGFVSGAGDTNQDWRSLDWRTMLSQYPNASWHIIE